MTVVARTAAPRTAPPSRDRSSTTNPSPPGHSLCRSRSVGWRGAMRPCTSASRESPWASDLLPVPSACQHAARCRREDRRRASRDRFGSAGAARSCETPRTHARSVAPAPLGRSSLPSERSTAASRPRSGGRKLGSDSRRSTSCSISGPNASSSHLRSASSTPPALDLIPRSPSTVRVVGVSANRGRPAPTTPEPSPTQRVDIGGRPPDVDDRDGARCAPIATNRRDDDVDAAQHRVRGRG